MADWYFHRSDIRFGDVDSLRIELVWVNMYRGGIRPAVSDAK